MLMSGSLRNINNAGDILIAIAHYLPENRRCFKIGREGEQYENPARQPIHTFFYEQKAQFPETLAPINFHTRYIEPESKELKAAISDLFHTSMIVVASNNPWHYHFSHSCDESFERFIAKRLIPKQDRDLQKLAELFDQKVSVSPLILTRI